MRVMPMQAFSFFDERRSLAGSRAKVGRPIEHHYATDERVKSFVDRLNHYKSLLLFVIAVLLAVLILAVGLNILAIHSVKKNEPTVDEIALYNAHQGWRESCEARCTKKFSPPPLLLISMDGFRAEYLQRNITPAISRLFACGSSAPHMMPSFPSKTYPNHMTIASGLYPEAHGIVDNHFYSPELDESFSRATQDSRWYRGEPIWNSVVRNGGKSAVFYWPGSEVPMQGHKPTYHYRFNVSVPFTARVDQIVEWLQLGTDDMPSFIGMYLEQPDMDAHIGGPESQRVKSALVYIDAMINYLVSRLDSEGLLGCLNIVLVSDHGFASLREDKQVVLEDLFGKPSKKARYFPGVVAQLSYPNGTDEADWMRKSLDAVRCTQGQNFHVCGSFTELPQSRMQVFTKNTMPRRYHYASSARIGQIVLRGNEGTMFFRNRTDKENFKNLGDHGFDNRLVSMKAVFTAYGPSVRKTFQVPPFQNIELYNLFATLLKLPLHAKNNGTAGTLRTLLVDPPEIVEKAPAQVPDCPAIGGILKCGEECPDLDSGCTGVEAPVYRVRLDERNATCQMTHCNMHFLLRIDNLRPLVLHKHLETPQGAPEFKADCELFYKLDLEHEANCTSFDLIANTTMHPLMPEEEPLAWLDLVRVDMDPALITGPWKTLESLIERYRRQFKFLHYYVGPVFDYDNDGKADPLVQRGRRPSHIFVVLQRCAGDWRADKRGCEDPANTRLLSFVIPNAENFNCLMDEVYLFEHTVRLRDIELLTGVEFLVDRQLFPFEKAVELRTEIITRLWQLVDQ